MACHCTSLTSCRFIWIYWYAVRWLQTIQLRYSLWGKRFSLAKHSEPVEEEMSWCLQCLSQKWMSSYGLRLILYSMKNIFIVRSNFQSCVQSCLCLQKAYCGHCGERIWGLGSQGYKCINCKLLVHKRCHRLLPQTCQRLMVSISSCIQAPNSTVTSYHVSEHSTLQKRQSLVYIITFLHKEVVIIAY